LAKGVGVSCGELAITLNDCYWQWVCHQEIYCFPKDSLHKDADSHVIILFISPLKRNGYGFDPTHDAYVMNEKGEIIKY